MVESKLSKIPEGWSVGNYKDLVLILYLIRLQSGQIIRKVITGYEYSAYVYESDVRPYDSGQCMPEYF